MSIEDKCIKVLLIEDDQAVAQLIRDMLSKVGDSRFEIEWSDCLAAGLERIKKGNIEVIFLDLFLPDSQGLDTLARVQEQASAVPILVLTGLDDEALAIKAMREGAQDYLVKGREDVFHFVRASRYAIERKRIQDALQSALGQMEGRVKERTAELVKANEQLQEAYVKLKETQSQLIQAAKMQVVGGLASGVAHEVKNPLAIIKQGVDYLSRSTQAHEENVSSVLVDMDNAVKRANDIIKGLLDFASLSKLDIEPHALKNVIGNCLLLMKHQLAKEHIRVSEEFQDGIPEVKIDKNRIEQVFLNLFMNAVDAMPAGGNLTIRMYTKSGSEVMVEVEDTGNGIPQEIIDKVFDPFFTTKRGKGGTGLGLAIVKNIMEMHNGQIEIKNRNEGGTKATLLFEL